MSRKTHKRVSGPDHRNAGQTTYEFEHTSACGYVRGNLARHDDEVTCKVCLRKLAKDN